MEPSSKSERFKTQEIASLEVYGKTGQLTAEVENLSQTGACLKWSSHEGELKAGDYVRLTFELSSVKKRRHVNAQVVWNKGNTTGIAFVKPEELIKKLTLKS